MLFLPIFIFLNKINKVNKVLEVYSLPCLKKKKKICDEYYDKIVNILIFKLTNLLYMLIQLLK